jgi:hypothetical protein
MIDLNSSTVLKQLSQQIKNDIDNYCSDKYDDGPRSHLGASEIGDSCSKKLWLKFRWTAHKKHSGQQQRLFQRGHFEEPRFVSYLEGIGCTVKMFDKVLLWHPESECLYYGPEEDCKGGYVNNVEGIYEFETKAKELGIWLDKGKRQIRISSCKGHFGGSCDALCSLPKHYDIPENVIFLDEFKTQTIGKKGDKFDKLVKEGVKQNKPIHWAQQCTYGYKLNINYGIYMSVCKNDDDLHIEVVKLDHFLGESLERKAEMIIFSETPPTGVSCSPSYFECNWCDFKGICYGSEQPLKNCRSCKHAKPTEEATWTCEHYGVIPKEVIPLKQPCWESII